MAAVVLRDYQGRMIRDAKRELSVPDVSSVLIQAPTGAGKTALASFIIGETAAKGQRAWFIVHRSELLLQTSLTFKKYGIEHGFIAAGQPVNLMQLVHLCSIDTLKNRLAQLKPPKVAIIDECHHANATGWALVIQWLIEGGTYVIGLSATPKRLDGQGLGDIFQRLVRGPSVAWLMEHGHLARYQAFIPDVPDMKGVRKQFADFSKKESAERMDKPKLTGNIITHWRKYAEGLRTIGFGVNVGHSTHLAEAFTRAGIPAAHLDGGTDKGDRKQIIRDYAAGRYAVLFNVGLFGEGFDLSAIAQTDVTIDCVIDAAPTQSLGNVVQRWGRALRPGEVKTKIILDHAGNMLRHGFPEDEREWSLDGEVKVGGGGSDGPPPPVICKECFNAIKRPLPPTCPCCGTSLAPQQREIEVAEGELNAASEAAKESIRAKLRREEQQAKSIGELAAIYAKRGDKNPQGKAVASWGSRRFKR